MAGEELFDREIAQCRELYRKNGGRCAWGRCEECGVIPLLHKLFRGELHDDPADVAALRREALAEPEENS